MSRNTAIYKIILRDSEGQRVGEIGVGLIGCIEEGLRVVIPLIRC